MKFCIISTLERKQQVSKRIYPSKAIRVSSDQSAKGSPKDVLSNFSVEIELAIPFTPNHDHRKEND